MTRELAIECIKTQRQFVDDMTKEAIDMAIEALKAQEVKKSNQEVKKSNQELKNQSALITIDKQAAIDALRDEFKRTPTTAIRAMDVIGRLPSAQPDLSEYSDKLWRAAYERGKAEGKEERKTGRWIWQIFSRYMCSECGQMTSVDECMEKPMYIYCPYCGAAMIEEGAQE